MDTPTSESLPSAVPEFANLVNDKVEEFYIEKDEKEKIPMHREFTATCSVNTAGCRSLRASKAFYAEVWQHTGTSWKELYHFNNGLEFDVFSQKPISGAWSRLQLPSTSLRALQQLRAAMRLPGALKLDAVLGGSGPGDLFDALLEQAGNVLRGIGGGGASQSEARQLLTERAGKWTTEVPEEIMEDYSDDEGQSVCSEVLSRPMIGTETIDVSICPLATYPIGKPPSVAILRLPSSMFLRRPSAAGGLNGIAAGTNAVRFAALVLCSSENADDTRFAREFSRALAISYMDEEFAVAARMTPQGSPERVLECFDSYLTALTLVPTVYMEPPKPKDKEIRKPNFRDTGDSGDDIIVERLMDEDDDETSFLRQAYLLSDSLADSIEKRICKVKALSPSSRRGETKLHRQRQLRDEHPPGQRRRFFIEVHERAGADRVGHSQGPWAATRRLRQGLAVEMPPEEKPSPPHLPRISAAALDRLMELMTPDSIGLDWDAPTAHVAVNGIVERLGYAGLPQDVADEVLTALLDCATGEPEVKEIRFGKQSTEAPNMLEPCPGDEACHVLILASNALPEKHGVVSAFLRFKSPLCSSFASCLSPVRFLMVLVGPAKARLELCRLKDALSALILDEDLMGDLTLTETTADFRFVLHRHVSNLVFISHTQLQIGNPGLAHHDLEKQPTQRTVPELGEAANEVRMSKSTDRTMETQLTTVTGKTVDTSKSAKTLSSAISKSISKRFLWCVGKLQKYSIPLVSGVVLAMVWENVHSDSYHDFTHTPFWSGAEIFKHDFNLHFFVNDIFMCFFFGLAIKEVTEALLPGGSLHPLRRAANPLFATCGGIVGPVAVYLLTVFILDQSGMFDNTKCPVDDDHRRLGGAASDSTNLKEEPCELGVLMKGWGVPTATDISLAWMFALLVFGAGHPCINFLLLLAIVDDALGMIIIAVFYPNPKFPLEPLWLLLILAAISLALIFRYFQVQQWQVYVFIAGPVAWLSLIKAHVHPALALCCVVPFMPAQAARKKTRKSDRHIDPRLTFLDPAKDIAKHIEGVSEEQRERAIQRAALMLEHSHHAPLHSFEHTMKLPVDLGMFFFGLANAGVQVGSMGGITLSVVIALLVGKTIGIAGFGLLAVALGFDLPEGISVGDLFAVSALGGIGLTVALFVANQAFQGNLQAEAKMGAVLSVGCSAAAFLIQLLFGSRPSKEEDGMPIASQVTVDQDGSTANSVIDLTPMIDEHLDDWESEQWVDDLLVDDILQTLWTQKRYKQRGTAVPKTPNRRSSVSKERCRRASSKLPSGDLRIAAMDDAFGKRDTSQMISEQYEGRKATKEVIGENFKRLRRNSFSSFGKRLGPGDAWASPKTGGSAGRSLRSSSKQSTSSQGSLANSAATTNANDDVHDVHLSSPRTLV